MVRIVFYTGFDFDPLINKQKRIKELASCISKVVWDQIMLQFEVDCENTNLVCDIIPGVVKGSSSEEVWFQGLPANKSRIFLAF